MTPLAALKLAIQHIEHMGAWITSQRGGYSFESLGEDMPGIRAAADKPLAYVSDMTGRFLSEDLQHNLLADTAFVGPGDFGPLETLTADIYRLIKAAQAVGDQHSASILNYVHERICRARHEISGDETRELPPLPVLSPLVAAAPDLLAALLITRDNIAGLSTSDDDVYAAMVRRMAHAISKATAEPVTA